MNVLNDPRVKPSAGSNDGSLDIELERGPWIAYPDERRERAGHRFWASEYGGAKRDLGPFLSIGEAVRAVFDLHGKGEA